MENLEKIQKFIESQLKLHKLNFNQIIDLCKKQSYDNAEVINSIRTLTELKKVVEYNREFYLTSNLEVKKGYLHSNLNSLLWFENSDKTNDFGLSFDVPPNITPIANKKEAPLSSFCSYVELGSEEEKTAFILTAELHKSAQLLISKQKNSWTIINNNYYSRIKLPKEFREDVNLKHNDGDILHISLDKDNISLIKFVGNISDKGIESKIVKILSQVKEPEFDHYFKKNQIKLPKMNNPFITIDGTSTKDIDDALSIEETTNGFKLFVAIANVDAFIPKDSKQDLFAKENSTTYYLESERIPMFHESISENLCSLNIGEEKPAFICEIIFDKQGNQKDFSFYESNITVSYKTPYKDVNAIFSGEELTQSLYFNGTTTIELNQSNTPKELKKQLEHLKNLTDLLKKTEMVKDYWFLKNPDFILGEDGKIDHLELRVDDNSISQSIVENCMLSANICAANLLKNNLPQIGIFRNQITKIEFEKPLAATYEFNNEGHWGLQEETYTHFTSPIRRYCDLVVHRIIKSIIYEKKSPYSEEEVKNIVKNINEKQYLHKQMNTKEKTILIQEYLQKLVQDKSLKSRFELVSFNKSGCLFRNKQLIDVFLPYFKIQRDIADYLKPNIEDKDPQKHIDHINNYWQIKAFIDKYNWLDEKKDVSIKFYSKDHKIEQEKNNLLTQKP